jgi:Mo-dependent nitrogenase C-terminus
MNLKVLGAKLVVILVPNSCPFERDLALFGHIYHIPPMCKFNPFYNLLMKLRFDCLRFLEE